ncbi:MAG: bifunctional 2-C-methyl-D-erythritol 4-phosphate cytidylyltransferase/2-C-methyl-D-erythritol 2,4-cyclodiphosphate synthase [Novosphingobium sp.]|nr:bifunctional 2-C-methyl-D-erythritol 4-phosphate cytidylyltransferase/2-C-methyl-D-erythritol 2,4-cyclodiphosphate synthase [Novosphingobium sp.]
MSAPSALPQFAAVIVAAGKGLRSGGAIPKQFANWRGKPVLRHSAEALAAAGASPIVVAIPENGAALAEAALTGIAGTILVAGGETRQASVRKALEELDAAGVERVLIHDAARPVLPLPVIERLLAALDDHMGAIPVLPVVDSLARAERGLMAGSAAREGLRRVQTPQAFRYAAILAAHRLWEGAPLAGDDAQVGMKVGMDIALVEGDEALRKLTFAEDFLPETPPVRVGTGYDVHRLAEGEELWLCGVKIEHAKGLAGHSDADVAIHAAVDAILGAAGAGDIGLHFSPSDPQWRGVSSDRFLSHALKLAAEAGYRLGNLDVTIVCEAPKIGPHRDAMRARLAEIAGVDTGCINVKATTTERLGFAGRGEGIAAQAAATLYRN